MDTRRLARIAGLVILVGCGRSTEPPAERIDPLELVPDPASLGAWRAAEGPVEYTRDTLYEYLDGGADRYLEYGFRALSHVRYEPEGDPSGGIGVDIYDMGSELGAFGIYRSGRPRGPEDGGWCTESYRSGPVVAGWKGRHYLHGEVDHERRDLVAAVAFVMEQICERIPGPSSRPVVLAPLPSDGLVPYSERWFARDLLGHAFLPGGVLATYRVGDAEVGLFYSDLGSDVAAADALAQLRDHELSGDGLGDDVDSLGAGGFRFAAPGLGSGTVVRAGRFVAGVYGNAPNDVQENLLSRLTGGLQGWSGGE